MGTPRRQGWCSHIDLSPPWGPQEGRGDVAIDLHPYHERPSADLAASYKVAHRLHHRYGIPSRPLEMMVVVHVGDPHPHPHPWEDGARHPHSKMKVVVHVGAPLAYPHLSEDGAGHSHGKAAPHYGCPNYALHPPRTRYTQPHPMAKAR